MVRAAAVGIARFAGWPIFIGPDAAAVSIALAIGFAAAVGLFLGRYSAMKAARLAPVEARRRGNTATTGHSDPT